MVEIYIFEHCNTFFENAAIKPLSEIQETMAAPPIEVSPLRRIVTTTNGQTQKGVFSQHLSETVPFSSFPLPPGKPPTTAYALAYSTNTFPVNGLSPASSVTPEPIANTDKKTYSDKLENPQPLPDATGTTCVVLEAPAGHDVPMHRTTTVDYGVVLDGTTELLLDSGERKTLQRGDVFVQRGTAHCWRNLTSEAENGGRLRIFFVFLPAERVTIEGGKELEQELYMPYVSV